MSAENDSPSADDGGRNVSQTTAVQDVGAVADAAPATATTTDECDSDVHSCGRCKLQFSNIDDFIKHKLQHGDCRLQYSKSGHLKLPKLIKKDTGAAAAAGAESALLADADGEPTAGKRRRGRPRKVRDVSESDSYCQGASTGTDGVLSSAARAAAGAAAAARGAATTAETLPEHKCSTCGTSFHRKAALKCHLLQEHGVGSDVGSDLDDDGDDDDGLDGYDSADNEWSEGVLSEAGSARLTGAGCSTPVAGLGEGGGHGRKRRAQSMAAGGAPTAQTYSCTKCPKVFSTADTLRAHGITHAEDRGFPCTVEDCHFAFKTKGSLKRHLRRHTDERPYKCNVCGRAFRESGALTRHLKSRTPCANKSDSDLPRYGKSLSLSASPSLGLTCLGGVAGGSDLHGMAGQLPLAGALAFAHGTDAAAAGAASGSAGLGSVRSTAGVLGSAAESGADDGAALSNIQRCCQVCKALFEEAEQLMEHLRSHLVQQQHQQPVQCGLCGHTAASGDALDEHVAQLHATELDAKVIDEALDQASSALADVDMDNGDSDAAGAIMYNSTGTDASLNAQPGDADDVDEVTGSGLQAVGDGEASASSLNGSYPSMSETGTSGIVVVKLTDGDEESNSNSDDGSSRDGLEATDEVDDESVGHSAVSDQDALRIKRVRDSTVAVQQLLQLSALLAASQAASLGSQAAADISGSDRELSASQSTKMAVALAQRTCPVCKRTFKAGSYLRLHMRSHTGERPHKCPHCPKDFATKDTFNKHLLAHSDERLYKCGECGKMFKRISHVKEHLKIHSSERPYPCSTCDKTFKTSNAWKVHMRTHSQLMAWQCSSCPRQFREKSSLVRHARTHTGERPYPCKFCGRHFSEHGTLNRHLRAKVPCTSQLSQLRLVQQSLCDDSVANFTVSSAIGSTPDGFPTVLTEFSSVVADTQYINPDGSSATVKALEQCIVLERGTSLEDLHSVLPKADASLSHHDPDGVGLPTFYVVRTSNSNLRVHYSCDDELMQQDGQLYATEAVVMLQSPAQPGSESAIIVNGGSASAQTVPGTALVAAEQMSGGSGIVDCGDTTLVSTLDDDEGSSIVVSSTSG